VWLFNALDLVNYFASYTSQDQGFMITVGGQKQPLRLQIHQEVIEIADNGNTSRKLI
jgi:hypothetical protein